MHQVGDLFGLEHKALIAMADAEFVFRDKGDALGLVALELVNMDRQADASLNEIRGLTGRAG